MDKFLGVLVFEKFKKDGDKFKDENDKYLSMLVYVFVGIFVVFYVIGCIFEDWLIKW